MSDRSDLLNELSIDRSEKSSISKPILTFVVIAILGGISFIAWYFLTRDTVPQVNTALAIPAEMEAKDDSVLDATGYVVARRAATVSSRIAGRVSTVLVEEGMAVQEGQLLATLDDTITRAQMAVSEASLASQVVAEKQLQNQLKKARLDLRRFEQLSEDQFLSQDLLDDARHNVEQFSISIERAKQDIRLAEKSLELQEAYLQDFEIRAPFTGIVIAKSAQPGEMIAPVAGGGFTRTGICTIVDMDSLEVEIDVNESFINRVAPQQQVTVQLNAYPDTRMPAEVIAIIPTADRSRATVRVRVKFNERDSRVLPDMAVRVSFLEEGETAELSQVLQGVIIPKAALDTSGSQLRIWVVKDNKAESRVVNPMDASATMVRIPTGLKIGERVVTNLEPNLVSHLEAGREVETSS